MTLLSAHDDLMERTLASVPGRLRRLCYLAELRDDSGQYVHWGLDREHGTYASQQALRRAHTSALLDMLRTPLRELWNECCSTDDLDERNWNGMVEKPQILLPDDLGGGSKQHFNSVVNALASLARARPNASRRAA